MWKESSRRAKEFSGWGSHPHTDRHTHRNKLCAAVATAPTERHYACWQCDRMAQRDPQTSRPHNETGQEHRGLSRKGGLAVGGAIGTCQSSCSPQRMCWPPLSPSVSEGWQLQAEADMSSTGSYLAGRMNLSQGRNRKHGQTMFIKWRGNFN